MQLADLFVYQDIVIQCHDKPDADAIASGYALLKYLEHHGKSPRLVYTGSQKVTRRNLLLMINEFDIPLEYLEQAEEEAELLVTVDCRAGERNVTALPCRNLAVIDHHTVKAGEALPALHEVRTEADGYASCATVLWAMLGEAGFSVESVPQLPTILYYGLYMDTQELRTVQRRDKELLDNLKYDRDIIAEMQSVNLSLEEIGVAGRAYNSLHTHAEHQFTVAQVEPCDPDLLGIIGDELMKVEGVDVSAAYCILEKAQCAKVSMRCRRRDPNRSHSSRTAPSVDNLIYWLVKDLGRDGGGAPTKAAGRIPLSFLREAGEGDGSLSSAAGRLIYRRLTEYFETPPKTLRTGEYSPEKVRELLGAEAVLYRKKKVPAGYVRAGDLFPEGEEIVIRMLEGEARKRVTADLYIMIGVDGETYHSQEAKLRRNYDLLDEPFPINSESQWQPKVRCADGTVRLLAPYAKTCVANDRARIWAAQLPCRMEVLTKWGEWHQGEAGDWLASQDADRQDIYIIKQAIFGQTYERMP